MIDDQEWDEGTERQRFELECVYWSRRYILGDPGAMTAWGKSLQAVGIRGVHPDTEVFVLYTHRDEQKEFALSVWGKDDWPDGPPAASTFGIIVQTNVGGP